MYKRIALLGLLVTTFLLTGCGQRITQNDQPMTQENAPQSVKIGVLAPLSGPAAVIGEDSIKVTQYHIDQYNQTAETKIELIIEDSKCSGKDATSATQKLINVDNVIAVIGALCSSEVLGAANIAESSKTPLVSALASSPAISDAGEYIYRYFNDEYAAKFIAEYFNPTYKKVAIVLENSDYGKGLTEAFKKYFSGDITTITYNTDEKDLDLIVKKLTNDEYDGIFLINNSDTAGIGLLAALKKNQLLSKYQGKIFLAIGGTSQNVIDKFPGEVEGLYGYSTEDITSLKDNKNYIEHFENTMNYKIKFDKTYLIGSAELADLVAVGVKNGAYTKATFKQYLDSINKDHPRNSPFVGDIYFDSKGDIIGVKFSLFQVKDGIVTAIETSKH